MGQGSTSSASDFAWQLSARFGIQNMWLAIRDWQAVAQYQAELNRALRVIRGMRQSALLAWRHRYHSAVLEPAQNRTVKALRFENMPGRRLPSLLRQMVRRFAESMHKIAAQICTRTVLFLSFALPESQLISWQFTCRNCVQQQAMWYLTKPIKLTP